MSKRSKPLKGRQLTELLASLAPRRQAPPARTQPKRGEMNRLESRYAEHLRMLIRAGEVVWWGFEPCSIKLAPNTHYQPDFLVQFADGRLQYHECKGHWQEDAWAKTKIANAIQPIPVYVCKWSKTAGWDVRPIHDASAEESDAA